MLKIISHDPKCDPCVRCTCGAEPGPTHPAGVDEYIEGFDEYIELSDSTVIVHVASDYMVNFDCADAADARTLAGVMAHARVSTDSWDTRGAA